MIAYIICYVVGKKIFPGCVTLIATLHSACNLRGMTNAARLFIQSGSLRAAFDDFKMSIPRTVNCLTKLSRRILTCLLVNLDEVWWEDRGEEISRNTKRERSRVSNRKYLPTRSNVRKLSVAYI